MFKPKTVKAFSILAIVLSIIGLLISILGTFFLKQANLGITFFLGIVSWGLLLWASIIGYKLCNNKYKLEDDEYKKVGISLYLIIVAFILFFFVGVVIGLVLSVILLARVWAIKGNYDDWEYNNTPYVPENVDSNNLTQ